MPVDQFLGVDVIREAWREHEPKMRAFLNALDEPDVHQVIEYRLPDGSSSSFPIAQMVQHVVNHASYHRGQLTMMHRLLGAEPAASTDLIRYYRERVVTR